MLFVPSSRTHGWSEDTGSEPVCYSAFKYCDKVLEILVYEEEKFILVHDFRGFNPWLLDSIAFRPMARQAIMVGRKW